MHSHWALALYWDLEVHFLGVRGAQAQHEWKWSFVWRGWGGRSKDKIQWEWECHLHQSFLINIL